MAKRPAFWSAASFPIPVLQGGANSGAVTIQFREYGVRLTFTPIITGRNNIRLHVKPEVSALDYTNALSFNGFTIPALSSRKMETNIELGEGQSFVIAGLIDQQVTETLVEDSRIVQPADPRKSVQEQGSSISNDTELVVMVTPEVTMPLSRATPNPCRRCRGPFWCRSRPVRPMHSRRMPKVSPSRSTRMRNGRNAR